MEMEIYNAIIIFNIYVGYLNRDLNENAIIHLKFASSHTRMGILEPYWNKNNCVVYFFLKSRNDTSIL